jgi:hypothetical protein
VNRRAAAGAIGAATLAVLAALGATGLPDPPRDPRAAPAARELIAAGRCHCGCGNTLPGSSHAPECFGCSVGRAEVSFIAESLERGVAPREILLALQQPVLVEVFGNYTDPDLPRVWSRARHAAAQESHHRVVLRAPAHRKGERRAVRFAECAREVGRFGAVRDALIEHAGPWDRETLFALAEREGLPRPVAEACLERLDVRRQLERDREHAKLRGISSLPAVAVDRERVPDDPAALRAALRRALVRSGI